MPCPPPRSRTQAVTCGTSQSRHVPRGGPWGPCRFGSPVSVCVRGRVRLDAALSSLARDHSQRQPAASSPMLVPVRFCSPAPARHAVLVHACPRHSCDSRARPHGRSPSRTNTAGEPQRPLLCPEVSYPFAGRVRGPAAAGDGGGRPPRCPLHRRRARVRRPRLAQRQPGAWPVPGSCDDPSPCAGGSGSAGWPEAVVRSVRPKPARAPPQWAATTCLGQAGAEPVLPSLRPVLAEPIAAATSSDPGRSQPPPALAVAAGSRVESL